MHIACSAVAHAHAKKTPVLDVTTYSHTLMQTRLSANQSTSTVLFILLIRIKPYTSEPLITVRVDPRPLYR